MVLAIPLPINAGLNLKVGLISPGLVTLEWERRRNVRTEESEQVTNTAMRHMGETYEYSLNRQVFSNKEGNVVSVAGHLGFAVLQ